MAKPAAPEAAAGGIRGAPSAHAGRSGPGAGTRDGVLVARPDGDMGTYIEPGAQPDEMIVSLQMLVNNLKSPIDAVHAR